MIGALLALNFLMAIGAVGLLSRMSPVLRASAGSAKSIPH
jgi:hypothetical protein